MSTGIAYPSDYYVDEGEQKKLYQSETLKKRLKLTLGHISSVRFLSAYDSSLVEQNYENNVEEELLATSFFEHSNNDFYPAFYPLEKEAEEFLSEKNLEESIKWLKNVTHDYFPGSNLKIELLPGEENEDDLLSLEVHGSFPVREFRERSHRLCNAMIEAGHRSLYLLLGIYQRRVKGSGRQTISWYGEISDK